MWRAQRAFNTFRNGVGLPPLALDVAHCDGCRKRPIRFTWSFKTGRSEKTDGE